MWPRSDGVCGFQTGGCLFQGVQGKGKKEKKGVRERKRCVDEDNVSDEENLYVRRHNDTSYTQKTVINIALSYN